YRRIGGGVIVGPRDGVAKMQEVVNDIIATTKGHIDLLLATHEHWDHLSGFVQAKDLFGKLKIDKVWLAWTEDPADELANTLRRESQGVPNAPASAWAGTARAADGAGVRLRANAARRGRRFNS